MGLADRTYMRGEPGGPRTPATHLVLGLLVGVFVLGMVGEAARAGFIDWMPLRAGGFAPWTWVTYALVHAGVFHLAANGFTLWFVGPLIESEHGRAAFWRVWLAGTLAGALGWWLTGLGSADRAPIVGASAAVAAMMVYGLADRKDQRVTILLFFVIPVPISIRWLLRATWAISLCGWVFAELPGEHNWAFWRPVWQVDIAHSAHLGGLLAGSLLLWADRRRQAPPLTVQSGQTSRADRGASLVEAPAPMAPVSDARAELDRLLDKISAEGFGSLTADERSRLESLSSRLR